MAVQDSGRLPCFVVLAAAGWHTRVRAAVAVGGEGPARAPAAFAASAGRSPVGQHAGRACKHTLAQPWCWPDQQAPSQGGTVCYWKGGLLARTIWGFCSTSLCLCASGCSSW